MEQSNALTSLGKRKPSGRMSPPSNTGGDADSIPQGKGSPVERTRTPPVPLLRPAQGAWDKSYTFGKPPLQPQSQTKSSPAAHTRSKDKAPPPASSSLNRVTHPESAQRHSQAPSSGPRSPSIQPPSYASASASGSGSTDHYRGAYARHTSPSQYSPEAVASPVPARLSPRAAHAQAYASPNYYSASSPAPAHTYARHQEPDAYPPGTRQWPAPSPETQDDIVVLLMEDTRYAGPEPDYQLAEVTVSLRPGDDGGWWADGEEVIKTLQSTPSRLEGASKVFARRGKYRQCFMRFSDDGAMEYQPSSIMVSRDKTIELIIEANPEGHRHAMRSQSDAYALSYAPQRPYDYPHYSQPPAQNAYPSSHYVQPVQNPNGKRTGTAGNVEEQPTKRAKSSAPTPTPVASSSKRVQPTPTRHPVSTSRPSTAGSTRPSSALVGLGPTPASSTRVSSPESLAADPISPYGPFQRHESLPVTVKAPKEVVNAAIVAYLRSHIQTEEGYNEFAASKGRLLPIPDLLKGYRFATRMVLTWANRKTPPTIEGCPNKRITKNHVLQALFRQTSWGSDCEQTLQLADKYGPGGPREDTRVVEILSGGSMLPEKSGDRTLGRSQGSVALLDFLKDVDKEYKARHEEELRKSASSGGKESNESGKAEGEGEGEGE